MNWIVGRPPIAAASVRTAAASGQPGTPSTRMFLPSAGRRPSSRSRLSYRRWCATSMSTLFDGFTPGLRAAPVGCGHVGPSSGGAVQVRSVARPVPPRAVPIGTGGRCRRRPCPCRVGAMKTTIPTTCPRASRSGRRAPGLTAASELDEPRERAVGRVGQTVKSDTTPAEALAASPSGLPMATTRSRPRRSRRAQRARASRRRSPGSGWRCPMPRRTTPRWPWSPAVGELNVDRVSAAHDVLSGEDRVRRLGDDAAAQPVPVRGDDDHDTTATRS